jgi:hypothetical protein
VKVWSSILICNRNKNERYVAINEGEISILDKSNAILTTEPTEKDVV